jgi:ATP-dependent Clp protease ATP-binding subunit ClpC
MLWLVREVRCCAKVLGNLGVELSKVRAAVEFIIGRGERSSSSDIGLTPRAKKVIEMAVAEARQMNHHYIGTEHLLLGLVREGEGIAAGVLESLGVTLDKVRGEVNRILSQNMPQSQPGVRTSSRTPTVDQLGMDLTAASRAGKLDPIIGRSKEIERVVQILSRRTKNNPVLIGEPGVGKTAIVEGMAHRIASGEVPETLQGKRLLTLDIARLGRHQYRGEFERLKKVIKKSAPCAASSSSTRFTCWSARAQPKAQLMPPTFSSRTSPVAICSASARRRWMTTASISSAMLRSSDGSSLFSLRSLR